MYIYERASRMALESQKAENVYGGGISRTGGGSYGGYGGVFA